MSGLSRREIRRRRRRQRGGGLQLQRSGPWIAAVGVLVLVWLAFSSVVYAPWWGVLLHLAAVVPVGAWTVRRARSHPATSPLVPLVGLPLLAAITTVGVLYGGWRA